MKLFITLTALVAVAVAVPTQQVLKPVDNYNAQLDALVAAIQNPSTDPATAVLLQQQLADLIASTLPISVGPAIIDAEPVPVVTPILPPVPVVDPIQPPISIIKPILPPVTSIEPEQAVEPAFVPETVAAGVETSPLVQIILNINQVSAPADSSVAPSPVTAGETIPDVAVHPVFVAESDIVAPAPVAAVEPILVAEPIIVAPAPVAAVEPILVAEPIIVAPAPVAVAKPVQN